MESPSLYTALLAPRFPFTHWFAFVLQPSLLGEGAGSFAHWSRLADGFAADAPVAEKTDPIAKRKIPIRTSFVLKCRIEDFEAC